MRLSLLTLCLALGMASACAQETPRPVLPNTAAAFDPMVFFSGATRSWGVMENRSGAPTQTIVTGSHGDCGGDGRLHMTQRLSFQDGTEQLRVWTLWRTGPNRYEATANDMVGTARGEATDRTFHWQWVLARAPNNPLMNVTMNQWMYRMDDGSVTIRTTIGKFGIILAEVTEQFTRGADDGVPPQPCMNAFKAGVGIASSK